MQFEFGDITIHLPPFAISLVAICIFYFLYKWSKEVEKPYTIFLYFLISTYIAPLYSRSTEEGDFQLWFPLGFLAIMIYLYQSKRNHPSKKKASLLGFAVAIIMIVNRYIEYL